MHTNEAGKTKANERAEKPSALSFFIPSVMQEQNHPAVSDQRSAYKPIKLRAGNDKGKGRKGQNGANMEAKKTRQENLAVSVSYRKEGGAAL